FLRLKGQKKIFIAGDVAGVNEEKLAQNAEKQAKSIIKNIINLEKNELLESYVGSVSPMVISLGKWNGIFIWKKFTLTGIIPGILKGIIEWREMIKLRM